MKIMIENIDNLIKKRKSKSSFKFNDKIIITVLGIVLVGIVALNAFSSTNMALIMNEKISEFQELNRPAKLKITKIDVGDCINCFDINTHFESIKSSDKTDVIEEKILSFPSPEAQDLINKYSIEKLPTMIIEGEVDKDNVAANFDKLRKVDNVVIFNQQEPPYYDVSIGRVVGEVTLTLINDQNCQECVDLSSFSAQLKQQGVAIVKENNLDYSSPEGRKLINKYKIDKVPALLLSNDIIFYREIIQPLRNIGTFESDGLYVLRTYNPPYLDLSTNDVLGRVSVTYLDDASCSTCYDVNIQRDILQQYGVFIANETFYDINSDNGQAIINKYNITKVPTIIISPEISVYSSITQVWDKVGTIADDGFYIFTNGEVMEQLGGFIDLSQPRSDNN